MLTVLQESSRHGLLLPRLMRNSLETYAVRPESRGWVSQATVVLCSAQGGVRGLGRSRGVQTTLRVSSFKQ